MNVIRSVASAEATGSVRSAVDPRSLFAAQRAVLAELLTSYPYNSASQIHEYFGVGPVPFSYGGSCAWQSFEAARMVNDRAGVQPEYRIDGRHVALVYRDDDGLTVLDPYLMHGVPLRLERDDAVNGEVSVAVDAFPHRVRRDGSPAPASVRARWQLDDDTVSLAYLRFSPRRNHRVISRSFLMRPDRLLMQAPPAPEWVRPQLLHSEQHSVSIRVVHPGSRELAEVVMPLAGRRSRAGAERFISKDNQGSVARYGSREFGRDREVVADAVGMPGADIEDFLLEAAALHRAAAPAGLELADYSLEDE
ncbi:hypothetical protein [Streptomyces sp. 2A115]|uniref:hypothetical protein n=1 Tax=Streptomyces sp. 2A115 TaxID=3457439 RepID=UPI003FD0D286